MFLDSCEPVYPKMCESCKFVGFFDLGLGFVGGWKMFSMSKSYPPASICLHGVFAAAGAAISVANFTFLLISCLFTVQIQRHPEVCTYQSSYSSRTWCSVVSNQTSRVAIAKKLATQVKTSFVWLTPLEL